MAGIQQLIFDIIARDAASPAFAKLGATAAGASGNVSELSRRIDDLGRKSAQARVGIDGNLQAQAALDRLDAQLLSLTHKTQIPLSIEGAARAAAEISALELQLEKLGGSGGSAAAKAVGPGGLAGAGGMGALIAAGVALSPVIITLGTGLAGLAVAGYSTISPILRAAQATGGLQANMHKLNPEQQQLAQSLLGTASAYHKFSMALQPEVIGVFNQGIRVAGLLLHDIEPVAAATGKAFGTFLGQFGKMLQDPQWQGFWAFMAKTAPEDMRVLGQFLIDLTNDLPPLVEGLQQVAIGLLTVGDDAAKALLWAEKFTGAISTQNAKLAQAPPSGSGWAGWIVGSYIQSVRSAEFWTGKLTDSLHITSNTVGQDIAPAVKQLSATMQWAADHTSAFGAASDRADLAQARLAPMTAASAIAMHDAALRAFYLQQQLQAVATQTTAVMTAQQAALATQLGYGSSLVTTANDAQALRDKLKLSGGQVGLQSQLQRDSFAAANTYITDLGNTAVAAYKSGHGIDASITAIRDGLPLLDSAKTKNRQYWQEVQTLVGWLDRLRAEKAITEAIHVSGTGVWSVTPGKIGLPGGTAGGPFPQAAGGMIRGGIPGRDSVLISAMPGEVVVPAGMVAAGLVDHLRGALPGFAAGGVVGSYAGNVAGLGPWAGGELNATTHAIAASVAQALTAGMKAAITGAGAGGAGVMQWAPLILQVLAMLGQSPGNLGPVEHRMAQESGGNPRAINLTDINAQLGQPSQGLMQVIPPTFFTYAGPFLSRGIYDPLANIYAGLNYAISSPAYRGRSLASVMLQPGGYDSGGMLPVGASIAVNTSGRPESVLGSRAEDLLDELCGLVSQLIGVTAAAPATTGASLGAALGMGARSATYRNLYP